MKKNVQSNNTQPKDNKFWRFCLGTLGCYLAAWGLYALGMAWLMMPLLWVPLIWVLLLGLDIPQLVKSARCLPNPNMSKMLFTMTFVVVMAVMLAGTMYLWQSLEINWNFGLVVVFLLSYLLVLVVALFLLVMFVLLGIFPTIPDYFGF